MLTLPALSLAQKPVISSCAASPAIIAPGETATIHVLATSPAGLPLQYIYTASAGTVQGNGDTATYTADAAGASPVTVLCEARSGQSWVRSRTWIKISGAASKGAAAKETAVAKSAEKTSAATVAKPAPQPAAKVEPPAVKPAVVPPVQAKVGAPPVQAKVGAQPVQAKPTPAAVQTKPAVQTPVAVTKPAVPAPVTPQPVVTPQPAPPAPATQLVAASPQPVREEPADVQWSKNGLIEYRVPQKMIVGAVSQVTVKIHGDQEKQKALAGAARKRSFRESHYVKVMVFAENPGEFQIASLQGTGNAHFVPVDGTANWAWNITPTAAAANQKLQVRVYLEDGVDAEQDVDGASYSVEVTKPSLLAKMKMSLFEDPDAWWKYWLPSGAILMTFVVLIMGLVNRRYVRATAQAAQKPMAQDLI